MTIQINNPHPKPLVDYHIWQEESYIEVGILPSGLDFSITCLSAMRYARADGQESIRMIIRCEITRNIQFGSHPNSCTQKSAQGICVGE